MGRGPNYHYAESRRRSLCPTLPAAPARACWGGSQAQALAAAQSKTHWQAPAGLQRA